MRLLCPATAVSSCWQWHAQLPLPRLAAGPRWALALAVLAAAAVIPLGCLLAAHLFGGSGGPFALYQWTQPAREVSDQQAPLEAPSLLQGSERGHQTSTLPVARLPPSQLRGPVRKTGPLISDRVLPSHFQAACQQAGWWAWLEGLAVPGSPAPRQPCQHCQLFVSAGWVARGRREGSCM